MKHSALIMLAAIGALYQPREDGKVKISSHVIEQKNEELQLSKQKLGRLKGKKTRKNRGRKRSPRVSFSPR